MGKTITKTCIRCECEFEGPASATQQDKCPACQKIHLQELRASYKDRYDSGEMDRQGTRGRVIGENTRAYFRGLDESIAPPGAMQEYLDCFCRRYLPHSEVEDDVKAGYYPTGLLIEFPDGMKKVIGKELVAV